MTARDRALRVAPVCSACSGTGKRFRNQVCVPCKGTGRLNVDEIAAEFRRAEDEVSVGCARGLDQIIVVATRLRARFSK